MHPPIATSAPAIPNTTSSVPTTVPLEEIEIDFAEFMVLDQPVDLAVYPNDPARYFAEKPGRIRRVIIEEGLPTVIGTPTLDFSSTITSGREQGLLAIAFDPDGWLYLGLGDGGSGGDPLGSGQDPTSLLGSMLRIHPTPSDYETEPGPFARQGGRDEIWATGLRNPWRFTFDRLTGDLWIGDVGQDRVEEIDMVPFAMLAGTNFGGNLHEGDRPFGSASSETLTLTEPIVVNGRNQGVSVTGGVVYSGSAIPRLVGTYLYSDFSQGWVRALRQEAGALTENTQLAKSVGNVAAYGQDHEGEVYIPTHGGQVLRLVAG